MEDRAMTQETKRAIDIITVQMVKERRFLYGGNRLTTPEQAARAFVEILGNPDREYFVALLVDGKNRISGLHVVSEGTLNQSLVHPREVYKAAILANSAAIILAHNHPTGDVTPSKEDREITRRLKEAGDLLGIRVLDHIIVDTDSGASNSFVEMGLL
jgi:DNA repair protein RadC